MSEHAFTLISSFFTFVLSVFSSLLVQHLRDKKRKKREQYRHFYRAFVVLHDRIHRGRAYDFSDLSSENQELLVDFLIENQTFADPELTQQIYILKTGSLEQNGLDAESTREINAAYRAIVDTLVQREEAMRDSCG